MYIIRNLQYAEEDELEIFRLDKPAGKGDDKKRHKDQHCSHERSDRRTSRDRHHHRHRSHDRSRRHSVLNISTLAVVTTDFTQASLVHKHQCNYRLHQTNRWAGRKFQAAGMPV